MGFSLTQCADRQQWDRFVASSPQGNVFCCTPFLDALGEEYDLLLVEEDDRPRLGAVVLKRNGQPIRAPYPFALYQGILFDGASRDTPRHRRVKWALEVTEFLLAEMEQRYDLISFCLHYSVEDLRSFQWFHYHEPRRGRFTLDLRYTGLLDLTAMADFSTYFSCIRKVRRHEYRRAQSLGLVVKESHDMDLLDRLHSLTFTRQGIERSPQEEHLVRAISNAALAIGFGQLLVAQDPRGEIASATLFLYDSCCGYYLFGVNAAECRDTGSGTYLLLENIRRCKELGLARVDFVGINSPNRGDFKTSFNAVPVPYFIVTWRNPSSIRSLSSEETHLE